MKPVVFFVVMLLMLVHISQAAAQMELDVETGKVYTGYNRVRIPGDDGSSFTLHNDLDAENPYYYRLKVAYSWDARHTVDVLYAPLKITSKGSLPEVLYFNNTMFAANTPLTVYYVFNSYRLTYRYRLVDRSGFSFGVGATGKIRQASIEVQSETARSKKSNVGFVPLIHYRVSFKLFNMISLVSEGDFLAAPQGRAEDIFGGINVHASERVSIKAGYRMLEGGADNDEVYTFALFHYAVLGMILTF